MAEISEDFAAISPELFEPLLESEFVVHVDERHRVKARLTSVRRLRRATERDDLGIRQDPFSLIFRMNDEFQLDQRIYRVEHHTHGAMEVFLVPVGFGEYECVFN